MPITIDLAHDPIILAKFDGPASADDVEGYIRQMTGRHAHRRPYVTVTWIVRLGSSGHTARFGRWLAETEAATRAYCLASALIGESAVLRFALAGLSLIKPVPCPHKICKTWPEAQEFVRAQALRRNVLLRPIACPWPELA